MELSINTKFKKFKRRDFVYNEERGTLVIKSSFNSGFDAEFNGKKIFLLNDNIFYLMENGTFEKGVFSEDVILVKDGDHIKALPVASELAFKVLNMEKPLKIDLVQFQKYLIKSSGKLENKALIYLGTFREGMCSFRSLRLIPEEQITVESNALDSMYFSGGKVLFYFFDETENKMVSFYKKGKDFDVISVLGERKEIDFEKMFFERDVQDHILKKARNEYYDSYINFREIYKDENERSVFKYFVANEITLKRELYFNAYKRCMLVKKAAN